MPPARERVGSKGRGYRQAEFEGFEILVGKGDAENDRLTFGVAYLIKKWAHLWKGIPSVLHRCGERREPLGACCDFDGHLTEAGSLEGAAKHSRIT